MNTEDLFDFIENSPTAYHAVEYMRRKLISAGYTQLLEGEEWKLESGQGYFVIRNGSALIAFKLPSAGSTAKGFQIMASHADSPLLKIKDNPEIAAGGHYVRLNVEKYGGLICAPWFDRPLSVAGRVIVKTENGLETRLVDGKEPMVMIPNLAIHMNREINDGYKYNVQRDMLPVYGAGSAAGSFMKRIAGLAGVSENDIIGQDLYVYSCMKGYTWGADNEFMSIGRLDDLECVYASMKAFLAAKTGESIPVHCVFDNEEVGSSTRQGAASTFLLDTLMRICDGLGFTPAAYRRMLAHSFMISADNAHAVHPNYSDKACPTNRPYMNEGIVIKFSANQKYTTDGIAAALFKEICSRAGVPVQTFFNRSDMPGGSTLGNIAANHVPLCTVDIGLPQLAMHSPMETAGVKDVEYLIRAAVYFYETSIVEDAYGSYTLRLR